MQKKLWNYIDTLSKKLHEQNLYHEKRLEEVSKNWKLIHDIDRQKSVDQQEQLLNRLYEQDKLIGMLFNVVKKSGIVEVAETGDNLFQVNSTVDMLQRNPLYKINKAVIWHT